MRLRRSSALPVRRVERDVLGDLALPAVAIRQQARLVVVERFAGFGGDFVVRPFDVGVLRAGLLAQAAVDALHHVDIVARGAAGAVITTRAGFDGDGLRRTDRLAQLAGDAAFFAVRIVELCMLAAVVRRDWFLLVGIV